MLAASTTIGINKANATLYGGGGGGVEVVENGVYIKKEKFRKGQNGEKTVDVPTILQLSVAFAISNCLCSYQVQKII